MTIRIYYKANPTPALIEHVQSVRITHPWTLVIQCFGNAEVIHRDVVHFDFPFPFSFNDLTIEAGRRFV